MSMPDISTLAQIAEAEQPMSARRRERLHLCAPCGSNGAYLRHRRNGEPTDEACRRAHTERTQRNRRRRKARQAAESSGGVRT